MIIIYLIQASKHLLCDSVYLQEPGYTGVITLNFK